MPIALLALAIAAFGIGTSEFIIMGILPDVAHDLSVSIPRAGLLVTAYALTVTIGGPFVAVAAGRLPRKAALILLMGVFTAGNLACALAGDYWMLLAGRILAALSHGSFFGIGVVVAASIVPRERRSMAIALMFSGLTFANVTGVPLGAMLGHWAGWRSTFWAIVPIGLISAAALIAFVPKTEKPAEGDGSLADFRILGRPQILLTVAISVAGSAALFAVLTYIAPLLTSTANLTQQVISVALLLFGVGNFVGMLAGGRLADWRQMPAILGLLGLLIVIYASFAFTSHAMIPAVASMLLIGAVSFATSPGLQTRAIEFAPEAPGVSATLMQSGFNLGNALGAWIGGMALDAGLEYGQLPWLATALTVVALVIALASVALERRNPKPQFAA